MQRMSPPQRSRTAAEDGLVGWYIFQTLVVFAVGCHAIYFEWNQNGYAVGAVAVVTAYAATWLVGWLRLKFTRQKQRPY